MKFIKFCIGAILFIALLWLIFFSVVGCSLFIEGAAAGLEGL